MIVAYPESYFLDLDMQKFLKQHCEADWKKLQLHCLNVEATLLGFTISVPKANLSSYTADRSTILVPSIKAVVQNNPTHP